MPRLLDRLLNDLRPMSRSSVKQLLKNGRVLVNGTPVTQFDHEVTEADRVTVGKRDKSEPIVALLKKVGMPLIFMDDDLLVIDKPHGLLSVATDTEKAATAVAVLTECLAMQRLGRVHVVHRLDRDTSGILIFARTVAIQSQLQANWKSVAKTYLAIVEGMPTPIEGTVRNYLIEGDDLRVRVAGKSKEGAQEAISRYRVVGSRPKHALVEIDLLTGRKHQIRVHMAGLGCPIVGDTLYGKSGGRLGLHASSLALDHPRTGQRLELRSQFPEALAKIIDPSRLTTRPE